MFGAYFPNPAIFKIIVYHILGEGDGVDKLWRKYKFAASPTTPAGCDSLCSRQVNS